MLVPGATIQEAVNEYKKIKKEIEKEHTYQLDKSIMVVALAIRNFYFENMKSSKDSGNRGNFKRGYFQWKDEAARLKKIVHAYPEDTYPK